MNLTPKEVGRYNRHLVLSEFGLENQVKLKESKVLVVGAGGLGSPLLLYLSGAGVGTIGVVDFDRVDESNLQRQVLFTEDDIGKNKAEAAVQRLQERNSLNKYVAYARKITSENALGIIKDYDIVVDGTDNFSARYLLNDACILSDKPLVYGSVLKFEGHVSVFNVPVKDGYSANYRDLFPVPPDPSSVPNCAEAGVLGVLPGLIGCYQTNEVIKIITGLGKPLVNRLLIIDTLSLEQNIIIVRNLNSRSHVTSLIDYDEFCGVKSFNENNNKTMKEVTVQELKDMMDSGADFQLIDVREPHEFDICNLGGELIPQGEIPKNVDKISKDKKVIIHCRSGARSGNMVQWLEKNHQFNNLYNLKGGILAWAREIDSEMPTY
jgi:sulfur-carrier protein adenylyltransferase/sulfurtransferase